MDCRSIEEKISAYIDDQLSSEDKILVEEHLTTCAKCRVDLEELKQTVANVQKLEEVEPPPWLEQKIMAKIREDAGPSQGLLKKLFFPININVPIKVVATIALAVTAFFVFKSIEPDVKKAAVDVEQAVTEESKIAETPAAKDVAQFQEKHLLDNQKRSIMELSDDRVSSKLEAEKAPAETSPMREKFSYEKLPAPAMEALSGRLPMIESGDNTLLQNIFTLFLRAAPTAVKKKQFIETPLPDTRRLDDSYVSEAYLAIDLTADAMRMYRKDSAFFTVRLKVASYNLYIPSSLLGPLRAELTAEAMSLVDALNAWEVVYPEAEFMNMRTGGQISFTIAEPFRALRNFANLPVEVRFPWKDEWKQ